MTDQPKIRRILVVTSLILTLLAVTHSLSVSAIPQTNDFVHKGGWWYDSWGFIRNSATGPKGFVPNLAYEALGEWRDVAFNWGKQLAANYPNKIERAETILQFVQQWTEYGYDEDNVVIDGTAQVEWAWNADEIAQQIDLTSNTVGIGDCEDLAFFCSALYEGAEFDTAIVLTPSHVALLIWLPEYPKVLKWDLIGDGRTYGWIWVEATGENNPLGWTPEIYRDGNWDVFVIERLYIMNVRWFPQIPRSDEDVTITASILNQTAHLAKVTLEYTSQGSPTEVKMEQISQQEYQAIIPKHDDGVNVEFIIRVEDQTGNKKASDPFSYLVGDSGIQLPDFLSNTAQILIVLVVIVIIFIAL